MATKAYDLAVKVGEYEVQGQKRNRYKNIGAVMKNDDGGKFLLIDATVLSSQLNGIANRERKDKLLISMFEPRDQQQQQGSASQQQEEPVPEDDIPF